MPPKRQGVLLLSSRLNSLKASVFHAPKCYDLRPVVTQNTSQLSCVGNLLLNISRQYFERNCACASRLTTVNLVSGVLRLFLLEERLLMRSLPLIQFWRQFTTSPLRGELCSRRGRGLSLERSAA